MKVTRGILFIWNTSDQSMGVCNSKPAEAKKPSTLKPTEDVVSSNENASPNQPSTESQPPKDEHNTTLPRKSQEAVVEGSNGPKQSPKQEEDKEDSESISDEVNKGRKRIADHSTKYIVLSKLGSGGYGKVVSVKEKDSGKMFAMKSVPRFRNGKDYGTRFWNESDLLEKLKGKESIVQFEDSFYDNDDYHLICEYLTGGELLDYILKCQRFSEKDASHIFRTMINPLKELHSLKIAHLDLKPENYVFSDEEGIDGRRLVMIDFGCAQTVNDDELCNVRTGTPYYIAPQMLMSSVEKTGKILRSCDMWSMGVLLFILTTGRLPFFGEARKDILRAVLNGDYEFPADVKLSDSLIDLISKLLEKDADKRYTAEQVLSHPWLADVEKLSDEPLHPTVLAGIANCWNDYSLKKALGALLVHELSEEDKSNLEKMFKIWDTNGDGMLQLVEIVKMVEKLGYDKGEASVVATALVDEFDIDKNGEIDLNEFSAIGTRGMLSLNKDFVNQLFDYLDRDGNGIITKNEIELYFAEHPNFNMELDVMSIIQEADLNRDGNISRDEFMIAMTDRTEIMQVTK